MARDEPEVYRITDATVGRSVGIRNRTRVYLIQMAIRTVCVLLCVVVPGWPKWLFVIGAVALPYLAVVMANAGHEREEVEPLAPWTVEDLKALPPGPRVEHDDLEH
jgi:predicted tellurium resistance membrane protein TerC